MRIIGTDLGTCYSTIIERGESICDESEKHAKDRPAMPFSMDPDIAVIDLNVREV